MVRHGITMRFDPPVVFASRGGGFFTIREKRILAELEIASVWKGKQQLQCDIVEKRLYVGDSMGHEYVLVTVLSAYDIWQTIVSAEDVSSEEGFLSGPCHPGSSSLTAILSDLFFFSDTNRYRLFRYIPKGLNSYHTFGCAEKSLSGSIDLMVQGYKPYPSGQTRPHDFVVQVRLDSRLTSAEGHVIPSGESLWFRVPFSVIGWLHTQRPIESNGDRCPWEPVSAPLPLVFEPTGQRVGIVYGVDVESKK